MKFLIFCGVCVVIWICAAIYIITGLVLAVEREEGKDEWPW